MTQEDVRLRGHAIECRIYAEDPENNFFPSPGLITRLVQPGGPGIREDCAVFAGWKVPLDYDPMLSKLVAFAPTREMAIDRMLRALDEYVIGGIKTNIGLFRRILTDEDFRAARIDTGYLERLLAAGPAAVEAGCSGGCCGGGGGAFFGVCAAREVGGAGVSCGEPVGRGGAAGGVAAVTVWLEVEGRRFGWSLPGDRRVRRLWSVSVDGRLVWRMSRLLAAWRDVAAGGGAAVPVCSGWRWCGD